MLAPAERRALALNYVKLWKETQSNLKNDLVLVYYD
jgi:hypothetical protein